MGPADGPCVPASCSRSSSLADDHSPETGEAGALQSRWAGEGKGSWSIVTNASSISSHKASDRIINADF